jgi:DNA-binding response OmpR family regulator
MRILIVDDEAWFMEPFFERLQHLGIAYTHCNTGSQALDLLKTDQYSLIVLDMVIPSDGFETESSEIGGLIVLREIRRLNQVIPVYCYTVLSDEELKSKISSLGGIYFTKGGDPDLIFNSIINYIHKK